MLVLFSPPQAKEQVLRRRNNKKGATKRNISAAMASAARFLNLAYRAAVPITAAVLIGNQAIYDVKGGSRAVIFDRISGVKETVVNEGTHFLVPWLQKAIVFDVRTKPRNIATTTGSKDLQMVSLTLRVLHRPNVKALPKIYQVSME